MLTAQEALERLKAGNARFVKGKQLNKVAHSPRARRDGK